MPDKVITKNINLKENERIVSIFRRSLWFWFWQIFFGWLLIICSFFLIYPLFQLAYWGLMIFVLMLLGGLILLFKVYNNYRLNAFILTNRRMIDIDHQGMMKNVVSSISYQKIEDVSWRSKGLLTVICKVGDIYISFISSSNKLKLPSISHPEQVINQIIIQQEKFESRKNNLVENKYKKLLYKIKSKLGEEKFNSLITD